MNDYAEFLSSKAQDDSRDGFEPFWMPGFLFDFRREPVSWALLKGKAAIFGVHRNSIGAELRRVLA